MKKGFYRTYWEDRYWQGEHSPDIGNSSCIFSHW